MFDFKNLNFNKLIIINNIGSSVKLIEDGFVESRVLRGNSNEFAVAVAVIMLCCKAEDRITKTVVSYAKIK